MFRVKFFSIFSIILVIFSPALHAEPEAVCQRKLKVGVSLPLTAGAVSSGESVKNSIDLADREFDTANCVEFVFEDDQLLAKNTVANVNKFLDQDSVDALVIYGTPTSLAVASIAEARQVPMLAFSIMPQVVKDRRYVMKHWSSAEVLNQAVVRESELRAYRKVAIVSTQNDAMLGLRDLFRQSRPAAVVLDEEFSRDTFDFRASILKIINSKAEAVYVLLYPPQTSAFFKQLRELKFHNPAFGVHNIEDPQEVEAASGAMLGVWLANGDATRGLNYFVKYRQSYAKPPALGGGNGYDVAKMLIQAAQQKKSINDYLHNLHEFQGSLGVYSATPNNDFDIPAVIKVVSDSGFRVVGQ